MMTKKKEFKLIEIFEFEKLEKWLVQMHREGWKFLKVNYVSVYTFEKCEPEDVVYQIDFQDGKADNDYIQIFKDYGWEYVQGILGMQYFRKSIGIIHKR